MIYYGVFTLLMLSFFPVVKDARVGRIVSRPVAGFVLGAAVAVTAFSHMLAISMVQAAYMLSLKRTGILFGILYGAFWFNEEKIGERLTGALVMLAGAFLIGASG